MYSPAGEQRGRRDLFLLSPFSMLENTRKSLAGFLTKGIATERYGATILFGGANDLYKRGGIAKYYGSYRENQFVYACVDRRGEKVGQHLEFVIKDKKDDKATWEHPLLDLLDNPNPMQTKKEFFKLYQTYLDLVGRAVVLLVRTNEKSMPKEMYLLDPSKVKPIVNDEGFITEFEYQTGKTKKTYQTHEIIYSWLPDPENIYASISPLQPLELSVDTATQLALYHYSTLKNGGKVEGILKTTHDSLSDVEISKMKARWKAQNAGAENAGEVLILTGGTEYQNIALTPTELSFLESKRDMRDDILMVYGVPKSILGLTEDISRANGKEANEAFLRDVVKPLIENIVQKFGKLVTDQGKYLSFIDPVPKDVELSLKKAESGATAQYLTINERREIVGLEPIENGDTILVSFNQVPLGEEGLDLGV